MEHLSHPTVTPVPPPSTLPKDHHGPFGSVYFNPLAKSNITIPNNSESGSGSSSSSTTRPRYFKNPWPSYRTASLHDAYLAYQLGAAVAFAPSHHTPGSSRLNLTELNHEPSQDGDDDDHEPEGSLGEHLVEETQEMIPKRSKLYVRADFSEVRLDDAIDDWREPPCDVVEPRWGDGKDGREKVTWLGHAGVLVQIPWKSEREGTCGVLFDPIFSYRCSPSQYVGPARYLDPPCSVSMLPEIHLCCISHDHYDHLDYYTIMDLWKYHQATIHFFVPLGLKQWFTSSGIPPHRVTELDWWHESIVTFPSTSSMPIPNTDAQQRYPPPDPDIPDENRLSNSIDGTSDLTLKVAFTPAQHRSGRGVFDHMTTLWGSWCCGVVEEHDLSRAAERGMKEWKGFKVYFGGDTGYRYATALEGDESAVCPAFEDIADQYAPFDLSLLPLSTGSSLPFLRTLLSLSLDQYTLTSSLHCSPADSMEIHRIIRSKRTLGIHWGTFCDLDESRGTRVEFGRCRRKFGISSSWDEGDSEDRSDGGTGTFVVADIGETLVFPPRAA